MRKRKLKPSADGRVRKIQIRTLMTSLHVRKQEKKYARFIENGLIHLTGIVCLISKLKLLKSICEIQGW